MTSERRLAEIRERLAAATPGPWELYATGRNVIAITKGRLRSGYRREIVHWSGFDCSNIDDPGQVRANAALIAHAPSDLVYLLDEIARLTRELEEARRERSAAKAEAMTAQASLRRVERELEEARERERALREALMTISMRCYEAVMQTPLLEHQSMHALAGACKQDADAALAGQSALTEGGT